MPLFKQASDNQAHIVTKNRCCTSLILKIRWIVCLLLLINWTSSWSEVTLDGSQGPAVALVGSDYKITEDLGTRAGSNLFHSFDQFNIGENEIATFSGAPDIQNVISRVTGGSPSTINGTIRSTIPNANLFLINPFGVIFGKNASLDVQGSFHTSTADYLGFTDGNGFSSDLANSDQVLTSAAPEAFGFLGNNPPSSITLSGARLEVSEGKSLSLIGGNISLEGGKLVSAGGRIDIASVNSEGEVLQLDNDLQLNGFQQLAKIELNQSANVDASAHVDAIGDGGAIFIRGGELIVAGATVSADSFGSTTGNTGNTIDIKLPEGNLELRGGRISTSMQFPNESGVFSDTGKSTSITIDARNILLDASTISSKPGNGANSGDIIITAENLELRNKSYVSSLPLGTGSKVGNIIVTASNIVLTEGGFMITSSFDTTDAVNIRIKAENIEMYGRGFIQTSILGSSISGDININTTNILLTDLAFISAEAGDKGTGNILINANSLQVQGGIITSFSSASANGGDITINAMNIKLSGDEFSEFDDFDNLPIDQDAINSLKRPGINTITVVAGDAGNININSDNIAISDGARINASTFKAGNGGNINIKSKNISLTGKATDTVLVSKSKGEGQAGDIVITENDSLILDNATISVESFSSNAGNIIISTNKLIELSDSQITTSVVNGSGGNINIGSQSANTRSVLIPDLIVLDNSRVIARARVGSGGNIDITSDLIFKSGSSVVDASSSEGEISGTVNINSPETNLSGSLVALPDAYFSASDHLSAHCSARAANVSSFVIKDRDVVPPGPDDAASSIFYGDDAYQNLSEDQLSATTPDLNALNHPRNINTGLVIAESGCGE